MSGVLAAPSTSGRELPAWRRLLQERAALAGGGIVLAFIAVAALAPLLAPWDLVASDWALVRGCPGGLALMR